MLFSEILKEVGDAGQYQWRLVFLLLAPITLIIGIAGYGVAYISYTPDHWCLVAGISHLSNEDQKQLVSPFDGVDYDSCLMNDIDYGNITTNSSISHENISTIECPNGWSYDQTEFLATAVTELNLVCDDKDKVTHLFSVTILAGIFGGLITAWISDGYGRKKAIIFALLLCIATGLISPPIFMDYKVWFFTKFISGLMDVYTPALLLVLESATPSLRSPINAIAEILWPTSLIIVAIYYYFLPNWRYISIFCNLAFIPALLVVKYIPESPSWLLSKGRHEDAGEALQRIARINGHKTPVDLLDKLKKVNKSDEKTQKTVTFLSILKYPKLLRFWLIITFAFLANIYAYEGLLLNALNLKKNFFINNALLGLVDLPSGLFCWWAIETRFGRRWTNCILMFFCGISLCIPAFLPENQTTFIMICSLFGKLTVSGTYMIIYQQATEIFPTNLRNQCMATANATKDIFAVFIPYISALGQHGLWIPLVVFGILCLISSFLQSFLPETQKLAMPQTMKESEAMAKDDEFFSFAK